MRANVNRLLNLPAGGSTLNFFVFGCEIQESTNQLTKAPRPMVVHCWMVNSDRFSDSIRKIKSEKVKKQNITQRRAFLNFETLAGFVKKKKYIFQEHRKKNHAIFIQ